MPRTPLILFVAAACGFANPVNRAAAQGSLTPPGPPGPAMITLSQIEPRTPIASAPYTITSPGSYYLTADLTVASNDVIHINASGVTLDLNGFTLATTDSGNTGNAITINGTDQNIRILNGNVLGNVAYDSGPKTFKGGGFRFGICCPADGTPSNVRVSGVGVAGCLYDGISLDTGVATVVESCTVYNVGGAGIIADSVANSSASGCGLRGITAGTVNNCYAYSLTDMGIFATVAENCYGITASPGFNLDGTEGGIAGINASCAQNCYGVSTGGMDSPCYGIFGFQVLNSYGSAAGLVGFGIWGDSVQNSQGYCTGESGTGIYAFNSAENCFGYCQSGTGLQAADANFCFGGGIVPVYVTNLKYNMP